MASAPIDFFQLFDRLPNAFMVLDRELKYVAANQAYLRATDTELANLVGRYVFDVFPESEANTAMLGASFRRVLATGQVDEMAALVYHVARPLPSDPEERVWTTRHSPLFDADGNVAYVVQETTEITHLRSSEAKPQLDAMTLDRALRVQTNASTIGLELRDLKQMFAQAPGFMCFLRGPEHVFDIVNPAYLQLVGHRDVVGMRVGDALPEIVAQGFVQLLDRVFESGNAFLGKDLQVMLQHAPGAALEERWLDFIYQPIRDASGAMLGIFVQGQDVTAQHRADDERKRAAAELAERSQYEQRLIGIVSHDLRNPLSALSVGTLALAELDPDPATQRILSRMTRAADRATRLINDLLDFARARIGSTIPVNPQPTNLREIVEQVVDELQSTAPGRVIRIGHDGDETGAWDADRLAQVVSNLVGNALQHGTAGTPIVVASRIDAADAVLTVENEGPHIAPGELATLFSPYQRGTNHTHARGSMGLGLFIAREVITAHGGSIEVETLPPATTRFIVRLPRFVAASR